jgi:hypothetical protein
MAAKVNSKKAIKLTKISKASYFCHISVIFDGHNYGEII